MNTATSTEIETRSSGDLAAIEDLERILLSSKRVEVVDDPEQISREIVAQLLAAETDEELENFGNATGWAELEGIPVEIHGFRWRPSSFDQGAPVFFVVQATRLDKGEAVVLTTGSWNVLAALANLAKRGKLPGAIRKLVRSERPTAAGYYPFWLQTPKGKK